MAAGYSPSLTDEADATGGGRLWLAVVAALAAGWGALFAYSSVFLAGDEPLRPPSRVEAARPETAALEYPLGPGPAAAIRPVSLVVPARPPAPAEPAALPAAPVAPASSPAPAAARAEYVGTWGPNAAACGSPSRRRGFIPATITAERAQAGRTVCAFRDGHRVGNAWVMEAACSERGRRWSSQVRLVVDGERLTWSSGRGTASYVRCRRTG